jgi:hypothetical protein
MSCKIGGGAGKFFPVRNDDLSVIFKARLNLEPVLRRFFCDKLNAKDCITLSLLLFKPTTNMFHKIGGCAGIFLKTRIMIYCGWFEPNKYVKSTFFLLICDESIARNCDII